MTKRTGNANRLAVLKAIRSAKGISRTDLPSRTGLSAGAVSQITAELVGRGLVVEKKEAAARAGRPRVFLEIAGSGRIVLGASMTPHNSLVTTFVDLSGEVRFEQEVEYPSRKTLDDLAESVATALAGAIDASGFVADDIEHVGISMPALLDSSRGVIHFMATFAQAPIAFAEMIRQKLELPVTIEPNITCMARAEHWFGRSRQFESFTLLKIGLAVGSAVYTEGLPKGGAHGISSEIGHAKTVQGPDAELCYCGARGCATAYASVYGVVSRAGLLNGFDFPIEECRRMFDGLLAAAGQGDQQAIDLFSEAGTHLGLLVANHINMADPGAVLIVVPDERYTGLVATAFDTMLRRNTMPALLALTEVRFINLLDHWQRLGVAALALEKC